jgi:hypothetical protein
MNHIVKEQSSAEGVFRIRCLYDHVRGSKQQANKRPALIVDEVQLPPLLQFRSKPYLPDRCEPFGSVGSREGVWDPPASRKRSVAVENCRRAQQECDPHKEEWYPAGEYCTEDPNPDLDRVTYSQVDSASRPPPVYLATKTEKVHPLTSFI